MYITNDKFKRLPFHGIDCNRLDPDGTPEDNAAVLTDLLNAAAARVHVETGVDSFAPLVGTVEKDRAYVNRFGEVTIRPRCLPLTGVTSVRYRLPSSASWVNVDTSTLDVDERKFSFTVGYTGIDALIAGYTTPAEVDALRKTPLIVEYTYNSGYTTYPIDLQYAEAFYAVDIVLERGANSTTTNGTPSIMGGSPYDRTLKAQAEAFIKRWKRVV